MLSDFETFVGGGLLGPNTSTEYQYQYVSMTHEIDPYYFRLFFLGIEIWGYVGSGGLGIQR